MFDCPLVYSCHPVLVQECPEHAPPEKEPQVRRQRDELSRDLASSRILIQAHSIEEEQDEEEDVLIPPRKFSTNFVPPAKILQTHFNVKTEPIEVLPDKP